MSATRLGKADVLLLSARVAAYPAARADASLSGLRPRVSVKHDTTVMSNTAATQFVPAPSHASGDATYRDQQAGRHEPVAVKNALWMSIYRGWQCAPLNSSLLVRWNSNLVTKAV
jgi:hypothetical protein